MEENSLSESSKEKLENVLSIMENINSILFPNRRKRDTSPDSDCSHYRRLNQAQSELDNVLDIISSLSDTCEDLKRLLSSVSESVKAMQNNVRAEIEVVGICAGWPTKQLI